MQNYIFALLTGYCDPPAGVKVPDGMHYNPYFPGALIGMAKSLFNEVIEYDDGKLIMNLLYHESVAIKIIYFWSRCRSSGCSTAFMISTSWVQITGALIFQHVISMGKEFIIAPANAYFCR